MRRPLNTGCALSDASVVTGFFVPMGNRLCAYRLLPTYDRQ